MEIEVAQRGWKSRVSGLYLQKCVLGTAFRTCPCPLAKSQCSRTMKAWSPALSCLTGRGSGHWTLPGLLPLPLTSGHWASVCPVCTCEGRRRPTWPGAGCPACPGSVVCRRRLRVGSPPAGGHEGSHSCLKLPRTGFPVIFRYGGFLDLNCSLLIDTMCESEGSSLG